MDEFMKAAIQEAETGLREGGIPIGSVLVHRGQIIGRGHNRRIQKNSAILHGDMDALENAGRHPASVYRESRCISRIFSGPESKADSRARLHAGGRSAWI